MYHRVEYLIDMMIHRAQRICVNLFVISFILEIKALALLNTSTSFRTSFGYNKVKYLVP